MNIHPLADAWPQMADEDFRALIEDVRQYGVREAITTLDGQILDGRHRFRAALEAGVPYETVPLPPHIDPAAFVLSMNAHRRHLTATQRAASVVSVYEWRIRESGPGADMVAEARRRTNKDLAAEADVSVATVRKVKRHVRDGHGQDLISGKATLRGLDDAARKTDGRPRPKSKVERLIAENEALRADLAACIEAKGGAHV